MNNKQQPPKRFEDYTFSELLEHKRNSARSEAGMERVMQGHYRNPVIDSSPRPNAARGPRPNTYYKQQRSNLNNGKVQIQSP